MLRIGTSGWQYGDWRGVCYPDGLPQRRWLAWYAERFGTVEVNATFYRLPPVEAVARWVEETPADLVFATKMSRFLTHLKRLRDPEEPVARFFDRTAPLAPRQGPVLVQLPPDLRVDPGLLDGLLAVWPPDVRLAFEARHPSWATEPVFERLAAVDAAWVLADRRSRPVTALVATASWGYVRLHEGSARPWPRYGRRALRSWLERIVARWPDPAGECFVYFNNDPGGAALHDAVGLARVADAAGVARTRVRPFDGAGVPVLRARGRRRPAEPRRRAVRG